jgi:hypothetical protein
MEQGGIPHEQLVQTFRNLIKEQQDIHAALNSFGAYPNEPEVLPPERAVRSVLEWYSGSANKEVAQNLFMVRTAWDALTYDKYEPGTREEGLAGSVLQAYSGATRESTVKLTYPMQVRVLDALTEAAGVPHQRGKTEVEIPEKLRNYNKSAIPHHARVIE